MSPRPPKIHSILRFHRCKTENLYLYVSLERAMELLEPISKNFWNCSDSKYCHITFVDHGRVVDVNICAKYEDIMRVLGGRIAVV